MTTDRMMQARVDRERKRRAAAARAPKDGATAQQSLVDAAEAGRFEAIVAAAQTEPPKMVTPEEREAELRRTGQWPSSSTSPTSSTSPVERGRPGGGKPHTEPVALPHLDPPPSDGGGGHEVTPQQQFIDENCRWRRRRPGEDRPRIPYGRCMTEYDPLTGNLIGDGYERFGDDDQW